jgi:hypothetical protein
MLPRLDSNSQSPSSPPTSASQIAGTIGMNYCVQFCTILWMFTVFMKNVKHVEISPVIIFCRSLFFVVYVLLSSYTALATGFILIESYFRQIFQNQV